MDIFLYTLGSSQQPICLTNRNGVRDEDPKFSPDGKTIIFMQIKNGNYDLLEADLHGTVIRNVYSSNSIDASILYYSADVSKVYYAAGIGANMSIHSINTNGSKNITLYRAPGIQEYYPITRDTSSFLYSRWLSAATHSDQIYFTKASLSDQAMSFNDMKSDNSDSCPVGQNFVIFSSTRSGIKGGYDLYIGDINTGKAWTMCSYNSSINSSKLELGASYSPF